MTNENTAYHTMLKPPHKITEPCRLREKPIVLQLIRAPPTRENRTCVVIKSTIPSLPTYPTPVHVPIMPCSLLMITSSIPVIVVTPPTLLVQCRRQLCSCVSSDMYPSTRHSNVGSRLSKRISYSIISSQWVKPLQPPLTMNTAYHTCQN